METKQFKTGYEAKSYLITLKKYYDDIMLNDMEEFESSGVEYGYILSNSIIELGSELKEIDFQKLRSIKIVFNSDIEEYLLTKSNALKGNTVKLKLSKNDSDYIDMLTAHLSEIFNARIYRAFSVKLLLKNLLIKKMKNQIIIK